MPCRWPKALKSVTGLPAALVVNGKPDVLYIGAEYCPRRVRSIERRGRWPSRCRGSARSRSLSLSHSSSTDLLPDTPTLTFHGSTFTSRYLTFSPVEETTNVAPYRYSTCRPPRSRELMDRLDLGRTAVARPSCSSTFANRLGGDRR